mgnify:CR=1 FL=1
MSGDLDKFQLQAICYICKKKFAVDEDEAAFQRLKRNAKAMHCCEDCKHRIELEARLQLGRRLLND